MAPKLRVLISSSSGAYPPTALCSVNSSTPTRVKTDLFDGEISVFVKGFHGEGASGDGQCYFGQAGREGMTYGIVVRGRYLDTPVADDVVFGNVFEYPIKDSLPWGTAIATKFMYFIDPTLQLDVYADKPWALSPAVATMNYLSVRPKGDAAEAQSVSADLAAAPGPVNYIDEDALGNVAEDIQESKKRDVATRRKVLGYEESRQFKLEGEVGMEFANGVLDFNTLSATLPRPFAISIPLLKYWDGQPVTYVCRRRAPQGQSPVTPDGVYWAVAFEIVDDEAKAALEARGGSVKTHGVTEDKTGTDKQAAKEDKPVKISDDLD